MCFRCDPNQTNQQTSKAADAGAQAGSIGGVYGVKGTGSLDEQYRPPGLRERLDNQRLQARHESRRLAALEELHKLMCKHMEVARMLELLDEVKF